MVLGSDSEAWHRSLAKHSHTFFVNESPTDSMLPGNVHAQKCIKFDARNPGLCFQKELFTEQFSF